jgi:Tol biopolymer transport system component
MRTIVLTALLTSFSLICKGQNPTFDYLGFSSPREKIKLFAPNIVSLNNSKEKSLTISPNGDEVFFSGGPAWPECKIMHIRKIDNKWSRPEVAEFSTDCFSTEPAFSPDGKYLYFSSSKGMKDIKQYCIWRIEKVGNEWSEPRKVIDIADPNIMEFHPTITSDGTVYFCYWNSQKQAGSIYKSKYSGADYSEPEKIILFSNQSSDTDPFVDPEEKYLIFSASEQKSVGGYDVYISFKKADGSWLSPVNFGKKFNSPGDEDSFDISPDGRFIFIYQQDDVYWTETKGVLEIN